MNAQPEDNRDIALKTKPSVGVGTTEQLTLLPGENAVENPAYLSEQLITYIGNKRSLLGEIGRVVLRVKKRLGKERLKIFDGFAGSGVVSRFFKSHAEYLASNDIEDYSAVIARCFLSNYSEVSQRELHRLVQDINERVNIEPHKKGFIEELYAPADESRITTHDRVFYTRENARRLDNYRRLLDLVPHYYRDLLLGPLLAKASVHANTAGVFKGFYKDRHTKNGQFGGSNRDALSRIKGTIELEPPVLSRFECDFEVIQGDANQAVHKVRGLDLAYFDPPYNQHPYGSNYFMLNLIVNYQRPNTISKVSGIPEDWTRSGYNVRSRATELLRDLVNSVDSKFILISFNNEGFVTPKQMMEMLSKIGSVEIVEKKYNTFRGSRNLRGRNIHVIEQLFLVERR